MLLCINSLFTCGHKKSACGRLLPELERAKSTLTGPLLTAKETNASRKIGRAFPQRGTQPSFNV